LRTPNTSPYLWDGVLKIGVCGLLDLRCDPVHTGN
jgi:hypothetical protein